MMIPLNIERNKYLVPLMVENRSGLVSEAIEKNSVFTFASGASGIEEV